MRRLVMLGLLAGTSGLVALQGGCPRGGGSTVDVLDTDPPVDGPAEDGAAVDVADAPDDGPPEVGPDVPRPVAVGFSIDRGPFVIHAAAAGEHVAFPDVLGLADGRHLLVYRHAAVHGVDPTGRIVGRFGEADGLTWGEPVTLVDLPEVDDRDPSLARLPSGELLLSYFPSLAQSTGDGSLSVHQVFVARSTDGGVGFGAPVQVPPDGAMDYPGARLAGGLWVDGAGDPVVVTACSSPAVRAGARLLLPSYGGNSWNRTNPDAPRSRLTLFVSDDEGLSWSAVPVAPELSPEIWLQEPSLLVLDERTWLMHLRTAAGSSPGNAGPLWQTRTSDGGETWEPYTSFAFIGHAPYLARLSSGVLLSAFRELNAGLDRATVSFVHSLDRGATWSEPVRIRAWEATEVGYPSIRELGDGRVLIVYYVGGTSIEGVIYRVEPTY